MAGGFACPRCGQVKKNRWDLSEHFNRKRLCPATVADISVDTLRSNPDYVEPTEHQCSDCQRSFGRRALEDHIANGRCAAVRQQQHEAALEPPAPAAAPAPQPAPRLFSNPTLSCIPKDDWTVLARLVGRVEDYEALVPEWRCVFERAERRRMPCWWWCVPGLTVYSAGATQVPFEGEGSSEEAGFRVQGSGAVLPCSPPVSITCHLCTLETVHNLSTPRSPLCRPAAPSQTAHTRSTLHSTCSTLSRHAPLLGP
jgi:hypothetical protein